MEKQDSAKIAGVERRKTYFASVVRMVLHHSDTRSGKGKAKEGKSGNGS